MPDNKNESNELQEMLDFERPKKTWFKRILIIFIIFVVGAASLFYFRQSSGTAAQISFRTAEATRGDLRVIVSATGTLEPVNQVDVGTEISGTILSVKVDFNDLVKEGRVLAVLDTTKLEAQRDQAQAGLAVARAELKNVRASAAEAKTDLARLQHTYKISGGKMPSRQELDTAKASYNKALAQVESAKASIAQSEASLKTYETELTKAIIKSPIDGMVLDRQIEPGNTVAASLEAPVLFTLAETLTSMSLSVAVDEADVGQVKEGQKAVFTVDAYPDHSFPARITQVRFAPQDDDGVVTYECILDVDNSDLLLRPGMTATADIVTVEVKDAVLVPNAALRFTPALSDARISRPADNDRGFISKLMPRPPRRNKNRKNDTNSEKEINGKTVWVLEDGRPISVPVALGSSDGVNTQIASGNIDAGSIVIIGQGASGQ